MNTGAYAFYPSCMRYYDYFLRDITYSRATTTVLLLRGFAGSAESDTPTEAGSEIDGFLKVIPY
jgi:hypothetical protein